MLHFSIILPELTTISIIFIMSIFLRFNLSLSPSLFCLVNRNYHVENRTKMYINPCQV